MAKSHWHLDDTVGVGGTKLNGRMSEPREPFPEVSPRKQLPKLCKGYKKYQGIMPPKCAGGEGCQVCWLIYEVKNDIK